MTDRVMDQDPGLYDYWPYRGRPRLHWPDGKKIAVWVAPNIEVYELHPPANPSRKAWPRPAPDILNYSYRDHGNRVGHWRLMEAMDRAGLRGSVSLSVATCAHDPEIIEACVDRGWEFFAHGVYNTRYSYNMDEAQERALLQDCIDTVHRHTGQRIRGYLAPALTHTARTLDLLADMGFWYTCDLFQDDQPQPLNTAAGALISMPYSLEVNDHYAFNVFGLSGRQYADMLKRQFDTLLAEGEASGTVMCLPLHAYLVGRAHRIAPLADLFDYIASHRDEVWLTTAVEIAAHYRQYWYETVRVHIASEGARA